MLRIVAIRPVVGSRVLCTIPSMAAALFAPRSPAKLTPHFLLHQRRIDDESRILHHGNREQWSNGKERVDRRAPH